MNSSSKNYLQVPPQFKRSYCPGTSNSLFNSYNIQSHIQKNSQPFNKYRFETKNSIVSQSMLPVESRKKIPSFLKKQEKQDNQKTSILQNMAHMVRSEPYICIQTRQRELSIKQQAKTPNREETKKLNRQVFASEINFHNPQRLFSSHHPPSNKYQDFSHQLHSDRRKDEQSCKQLLSKKGNLAYMHNQRTNQQKMQITNLQLFDDRVTSQSIEKQKRKTQSTQSSKSFTHIPQFLKKQKKKQVSTPISLNNLNKNEINRQLKSNSCWKKKKVIQSLGLNEQDSFEQKKSVQSRKPIEISNFQLCEKIGKGAYGDVFLAKEKKIGFVCVIKKISKKKIRQKNLYESILREITIQAYINHRHLTPLYGVFDDQQYVYLILELMHDDTLAYQIKKSKHMPQQKASAYVRQLSQALLYMHNQNIIHRDVKPDNVFLHQDYVKLGDMGCSVQTNSMRQTVVGCLAYVSPQQLAKGFYDEKIDVWSLGTLTYELLFGKAPFQKQLLEMATQQMEMKALPDLQFPVDHLISAQAKDFIEKLLKKNPQDRICIKAALKHPFIMKNLQIQKKKSKNNIELISAINQLLEN